MQFRSVVVNSMRINILNISRMANSVDPDQTAPTCRRSLIWIYTLCRKGFK